MSTTAKATTTARKRHRCSFCSFLIEKGEEYYSRRVGPMDHPDNEGFYTIKGHLTCLAMWEKVADNFDYFPPPHGRGVRRGRHECRAGCLLPDVRGLRMGPRDGGHADAPDVLAPTA